MNNNKIIISFLFKQKKYNFNRAAYMKKLSSIIPKSNNFISFLRGELCLQLKYNRHLDKIIHQKILSG